MLDLAGIGIGPFNLSIAALLNETDELNYRFFDNKPRFAWHPGLLLPDAHMQTCYLKDLVTAVAPTSRVSFLSYLVDKKRFYRFLSTDIGMISRTEFSDYMAWAASKLENLNFDDAVTAIEYANGQFVIKANSGDYTAKNICLGTGKKPYVPSEFTSQLGDNVFHACEIMSRDIDLTDKRVAVIGGGQTGADIVLNTLQQHWGKPESLYWISRRPNYQPLDEATFTNEFFTPQYTECFFDLPELSKKREVKAQKLASDGITTECLKRIYQYLYQHFEVNGEQKWVHLLPNRTAQGLSPIGSGFSVQCHNSLNQSDEIINADYVILATGFESALPNYLEPLKPLLHLNDDGGLQLDSHFNIKWKHQNKNQIYAVNAGLNSHGIAEPQLSLMAWRSATIINHLAGTVLFDLSETQSFIDWTLPKSSHPLSLTTAV
ncbi:lysine N(6)-hydroxylase/L-ornithine N(5)-oxygenase family protein [Pseudoalteromonas sp. H105]|uniref:lysine N(6)-hydroxylase/L-ornithine N(5)-oxygenase family protein n=1 Tax=Pseudoalteromonas sp. H105 TaxID=1348393 RepID=UPI0007323C6B|nr:SidA/IucD/PvdA family monooxygenase [Pseudoalteromonas sp. H105]KTF17983.1 lysine 6-monooxygenase [Pseudoalteromonas sp. H105]